VHVLSFLLLLLQKKIETKSVDLAQTSHPFLKIFSKTDLEEGGEEIGLKKI